MSMAFVAESALMSQQTFATSVGSVNTKTLAAHVGYSWTDRANTCNNS